MPAFLTAFAAAWQRFACRFRLRRRMRRELRELRQMSAHDLRDIGFADPAIAIAAATDLGLRAC